MDFADVEAALTQKGHGGCQRIGRHCPACAGGAIWCYRALIRLRFPCGRRCVLPQFALANPADVRGQTCDAERDTGILFQPLPNGFHALPFCEGGFNFRP